jgi:16S rRNA (guanine966-N2)-methyltransferase
MASLSPAANRSVRIIAGQWRGRRIPFQAVPGLRPTPDRVRETLFNWLQRTVVGCRCLDLYAGSGALGFEALSRGAAEAVMVEKDAAVVRHLGEAATLLGTPDARIVQADALHFLSGTARPFDVVFLDPPFALGALAELCTLLEVRGWLAPTAWIYLEQSARDAPPELPVGWQLLKDTRAGEVRAMLARREGEHR